MGDLLDYTKYIFSRDINGRDRRLFNKEAHGWGGLQHMLSTIEKSSGSAESRLPTGPKEEVGIGGPDANRPAAEASREQPYVQSQSQA